MRIVGTHRIVIAILVCVIYYGVSQAGMREIHIEKKILNHIATDAFSTFYTDQRCTDKNSYRVYLIDNFEQNVHLIPEVRTSHGEMLVKLLLSGRNDIEIHGLNTALSKGLAQVINDLDGGTCIDAVISSTPESNYTVDQLSSLLFNRVRLTPQNILYRRSALRNLMKDIAFTGFPSVE